ncbi:MAG: hypothetical protein ABIP32_07430 [Chthoniobacterales bacterium]
MNRIAVRPLACWLLAVFLAGTAGLCFVYIKLQQNALGNQTRQYESVLAQTNARIEVVDAKITSLTSRTALMHRVQEGFIKLIPIEDTKIARLLPPSNEPARHNELRTAANERRLQ